MQLDDYMYAPPAAQDDTRQAADLVPGARDTLSEAHRAQIIMDMLYAMTRGGVRPRYYGPTIHAEVNHLGGMFGSAASGAPAGFAQAIQNSEIMGFENLNELGFASTPAKADDALQALLDADPERDVNRAVYEDTPMEEVLPPTPFMGMDAYAKDTSGRMMAPVANDAPLVDARFSASAINPLSEMLQPDIADISRLGGGFAGYTEPDQMLERIRSLVRRL